MADRYPGPPSRGPTWISRLLAARLPIAWFLLAAIVSGAALVIWKLAVVDAPPQGALFVVSGSNQDGPSATITPIDGLLDSAPQSQSVQAQPTAQAAALVAVATPAQLASPTPTLALISVYVSGAVSAPGVYTLPLGSRIDGAVAAAGGPLPDADLNAINLAERLSDEEHVRVYHLGESAPPTTGVAPAGKNQPTPSTPAARQSPAGSPRSQLGTPTTRAAGTPTFAPKPTPAVKINLNTATAEDLQQVPGIGPAIAQRIIADRRQNGPYKSVEDLMRISGIKEGIVARIRDYVTVGP